MVKITAKTKSNKTTFGKLRVGQFFVDEDPGIAVKIDSENALAFDDDGVASVYVPSDHKLTLVEDKNLDISITINQ